MSEILSWFKIPVGGLISLIERDTIHASSIVGIELTPYFITEDAVYLWTLRLQDSIQDAHTLDWMAQVVAVNGQAVGYAGFHRPPDTDGVVEVSYSVDESYRHRGYARAMLRHLLERATAEPMVKILRASIRPDNIASLATIRAFSFTQVGEQWDDIDGLEWVFEVSC